MRGEACGDDCGDCGDWVPAGFASDGEDGLVWLTAAVAATWTFPLRMAEIVWGDGRETHRQTISLADTKEFDQHEFTWQVQAPEWKWARLSLWDIAGNGAFTTPIWRN